MSSISPQGYIYGKDPKSTHPFWESGDYVGSVRIAEENGKVTLYQTKGTTEEAVGSFELPELPDEIVNSVTIEETEDYYIINMKQNDIVKEVGRIEKVKEDPTDPVTNVIMQTVNLPTGGVRYDFNYFTKSNKSVSIGSVTVPKAVHNVEITGEKTQGFNRIGFDVDGVETGFDVPVNFVQSVSQSDGGEYTAEYTLTEWLDGGTRNTNIIVPTRYNISGKMNIDETMNTAELSGRYVVDSEEIDANIFKVTFNKAANAASVYVTNGEGKRAGIDWDLPSDSGVRTFDLLRIRLVPENATEAPWNDYPIIGTQDFIELSPYSPSLNGIWGQKLREGYYHMIVSPSGVNSLNSALLSANLISVPSGYSISKVEFLCSDVVLHENTTNQFSCTGSITFCVYVADQEGVLHRAFCTMFVVSATAT